jgi:hypothetical protein
MLQTSQIGKVQQRVSAATTNETRYTQNAHTCQHNNSMQVDFVSHVTQHTFMTAGVTYCRALLVARSPLRGAVMPLVESLM